MSASERPVLPRPRIPPWLRACGLLFTVGWGANQFSSMLLAYKLHRGVSEGTADALFGLYALGLIPALSVLGPLSDRHGRKAITVTAGVLSGAATVLLMAGNHSVMLLAIGRLLAGICSGAAFAAGTAWVKELSTAPYDTASSVQAGARRAAIALSGGFALGPLVAGLIAQWAPDALVTAYLPHLLVVIVALTAAVAAPETITRGHAAAREKRNLFAAAASGRFRRIVAPSAPWVFVAPSVAFAAVPALLAADLGSFQVGFAALTAGLTLTCGIAIQPAAARLGARHPGRGLLIGLLTVLSGLIIAAVAVWLGSWPIALMADMLLGVSYGLCLVGGLLEVQTIAAPQELGSLTAVFYALTYIGFATPLVIAELQRVVSGQAALLIVATVATIVICTVAPALRADAGRHETVSR